MTRLHKVGVLDVVVLADAVDRGAVVAGNGGKGFSGLDYVIDNRPGIDTTGSQSTEQ